MPAWNSLKCASTFDLYAHEAGLDETDQVVEFDGVFLGKLSHANKQLSSRLKF